MRSISARASRSLPVALLAGALLLRCSPDDGLITDDGPRRLDAARTDAPSRADTAVQPMDSARADSAPPPPTDSGARDVPVTPPPDAPPADPYDAARDACVAEINRYRAMLSLPPYERWREAEACADQMAAYDARSGIPHDGFNRSICSPRGNAQNECPRYGGPDRLNGCLAQMWAEGPSPDGSWDVAHGHYLNMVGNYTYMGTRVNFTRVACGFSAGGWMVQNFQ